MVRFLYAIFFSLLFSTQAFAGLHLNYSLGYQSDEESDGAIPFINSQMRNEVFLGVSLGPGERMVFGWNALSWGRTLELELTDLDEHEQELSSLEMGPRLILFLNRARNFYLSGAYHLYVEGERTIDTGDKEKLDGSAWLATFGMQMNLTRNLFMGLSFNYHSITFDESIVESTASDISHDYTHFYPAIELSFRFSGLFGSSARRSWPNSWGRRN